MPILAVGPLGLGGLLGAFMAAGAVDRGMLAHGLMLAAFCVLGIFWVVRRGGDLGAAMRILLDDPVAAPASDDADAPAQTPEIR